MDDEEIRKTIETAVAVNRLRHAANRR